MGHQCLDERHRLHLSMECDHVSDLTVVMQNTSACGDGQINVPDAVPGPAYIIRFPNSIVNDY